MSCVAEANAVIQNMTRVTAKRDTGTLPPAIVSADGTGSAEHKEKALREAGVYCADSTQHIVDILLDLKAEGRI